MTHKVGVSRMIMNSKIKLVHPVLIYLVNHEIQIQNYNQFKNFHLSNLYYLKKVGNKENITPNTRKK